MREKEKNSKKMPMKHNNDSVIAGWLTKKSSKIAEEKKTVRNFLKNVLIW